MKIADFNKVVEHTLEIVRKKLVAKGKEYSTDEDKFHNFRRAAAARGVTKEEALLGMQIKHTISIEDIVDRYKKGTLELGIDVIEEKITDRIAYDILLLGMFIERTHTIPEVEEPIRIDKCGAEVSSGPSCSAVGLRSEQFGCTRIPGHTGDHHAHSGRDTCLEVWPQTPKGGAEKPGGCACAKYSGVCSFYQRADEGVCDEAVSPWVEERMLRFCSTHAKHGRKVHGVNPDGSKCKGERGNE